MENLCGGLFRKILEVLVSKDFVFLSHIYLLHVYPYYIHVRIFSLGAHGISTFLFLVQCNSTFFLMLYIVIQRVFLSYTL